MDGINRQQSSLIHSDPQDFIRLVVDAWFPHNRCWCWHDIDCNTSVWTVVHSVSTEHVVAFYGKRGIRVLGIEFCFCDDIYLTLSGRLSRRWPMRIDLWIEPIRYSAGLYTTDTLWHAFIDFLTYQLITRAGSLVYVRVESGHKRGSEENIYWSFPAVFKWLMSVKGYDLSYITLKAYSSDPALRRIRNVPFGSDFSLAVASSRVIVPAYLESKQVRSVCNYQTSGLVLRGV